MVGYDVVIRTPSADAMGFSFAVGGTPAVLAIPRNKASSCHGSREGPFEKIILLILPSCDSHIAPYYYSQGQMHDKDLLM
jgi:hypothetical protein